MSGRVLLFRSGALGDTLLTLAALDALRRRFPGARLALAARPAYAAPLLDAGRVDELLDAGARPFHLLYGEAPAPGDDLDLLLRGFDASVFFTRDLEGEAARRLGALPWGDHRIASPFPPAGEALHVARWMEKAAAPDIPPGPFPPPPLVSSPASRERARALLAALGLRAAPALAVHPGSGGPGKWAPPEALAGIARDICGPRFPPLLIQGPADEEAARAFEGSWGSPLPAAHAPPTEVLGALLAECGAYLGCDSGVSHLAALCGAPALVLAGPASAPALWGPIGLRADWLPWEEAERGAARLKELAERGI